MKCIRCCNCGRILSRDDYENHICDLEKEKKRKCNAWLAINKRNGNIY